MRAVVTVRQHEVLSERAAEADEDVHFAEAVAAAVLEDLTVPGDRVLDPFAGYGTTLRVAQRTGRRAVGVELLAERARVAAQRAPGAQVITGDALRLGELVSAPVDLVLTSPPYMTATDHPEDPLAGYVGEGARYDAYLDELRGVLTDCLALLAPQGHLVVNVANIDTGDHFTPLAWDVGRMLTEIGRVTQDVFVVWDRPWHDLAGDYLLVAQPR
ncbi:TRM11 family SAM-dependent methyltransferase [Janibacter alkaliphilus]|nr:DNA methyltransferase [Janibacter alkaliphilus]